MTDVDIRHGTLQGRWFRLTRGLLLGLLKPLLRLKIEGMEHIPREGPLLVVCNHLHNSDPILVSVALPRPLHFMAKKELFSIPVIAQIVRRVGAFPVDRGKFDRSAIRRAEAVLAAGIAVGMFPEGTRSVTRALRKAHPGAGMIALKTGVPVLPAVITGSERLPGNGAKRRRQGGDADPVPGHRGVRVRFGPTFVIPRERDGRKLMTHDATEILMAELARMLPPSYRGEYAHVVAGPNVTDAATSERSGITATTSPSDAG